MHENHYEAIKKKYGQFRYPEVTLTVGGKIFGENKNNLVLSSMTVDLSTGPEASAATFSVFNIFDLETNQYELSRFKEYVQLGSPVTVSVGYAGVQELLFVGFIAQVRFLRGRGTIHHAEVTALDAKGLMMANNSAKQMTARNYGDAIKELLKKPMYEKMRAEGIIRSVKVADTPDKNSSKDNQVSTYTVEMVSESDYEFIVKAAKRFHYEFYVDTGNIYFRKAKQTEEDCLLEIGMNKGVREYDITYDMTGLVKSVEVRGMDTAKASMVSASKKVSNKISTGNKAKALIGQTVKVVMDTGAVSREQAQYRADALMEEISYRFGTLTCTCVGIPEFRPGHFIRMINLGAPCDNRFYITSTRHSISDTGGYTTYITAVAAALS